MFLALLPALTLVLLTLHLRNVFRWGWRQAFLRALTVTSVFGVAALEILSFFALVNRGVLLILWIAPSAILAGLLWQSRRKHGPLEWLKIALPRDWLDRGILLLIGAILLITALSAWYAAPNTYDSLTYHMSRVAHWAQEGGVRPYASGILRQNYMSPGAEMAILHTYVLGQTDRWANFIQWSAMLFSLAGIATVASRLGANTRGQLFAALFAATLPMGIAQATSTMTDYYTAMWVLVASAEVAAFARDPRGRVGLPLAAAAGGMALLSKPTAAVFLLPFAVWALVKLLRTHPIANSLAHASLAILIVLTINSGYLARNWLVFGNLLGGGTQVQFFTNEIINLRVALSNLLRNASLHVGTPWQVWNDQIYSFLAKVHWKLDLGLTDPRTSIHPHFTIWDYEPVEVRAPNTIQAVLIMLSAPVAFFRRKALSSTGLIYGLSVLAGFILFSTLFKFDLLGSRYHMPFFVLAAPFVALSLSSLLQRRTIAFALSVVLVIGALPALLTLDSRPLLPNEEGDSIVSMRRLDQYFWQAPGLDEPLIEMKAIIEDRECQEVGIMLRGDAPEYPLWVLLGKPASGTSIRWIISESDVSGSFAPGDYVPCAVICEGCEHEGEFFNDLPLQYQAYGFRLYIAE